MTGAIRQIVERELFCGCGGCEEALRDILRMEQMMCPRAKAELTRRRNRIRRWKNGPGRREYFREYARERRSP